jgi:hypothetical protein
MVLASGSQSEIQARWRRELIASESFGCSPCPHHVPLDPRVSLFLSLASSPLTLSLVSVSACASAQHECAPRVMLLPSTKNQDHLLARASSTSCPTPEPPAPRLFYFEQAISFYVEVDQNCLSDIKDGCKLQAHRSVASQAAASRRRDNTANGDMFCAGAETAAPGMGGHGNHDHDAVVDGATQVTHAAAEPQIPQSWALEPSKLGPGTRTLNAGAVVDEFATDCRMEHATRVCLLSLSPRMPKKNTINHQHQ